MGWEKPLIHRYEVVTGGGGGGGGDELLYGNKIAGRWYLRQ